ncbi:hypothetical protein JG687_00014272 [Phytophthora cactorum]|uniref:Uncharacterized protein n=1 Tax=Phytophthora cactorum TaxID=29920 RepID=A0A329T1G2_9STRA|nr:hypothetical protein Pcac1_g23743 [Phytophthora cactorum]KAG2833161.1 hypothetical protein PC112_g6596 [Phytophthora cactorum]KAG2835577.1 hypothetical protein PC111_g5396 [Phytophthora cactorum]KAG2866485.1 hypothetical protein PC113_g2796 [Phytophthora cactorum]KAG2917637.1 hypothetical protein PC114_g7070 [Phytophthora cactorum]
MADRSGTPLEDGEDAVNETIAIVEEERLTVNDLDEDVLDKSGEVVNEDWEASLASVAPEGTVPIGPGEDRLSDGDRGPEDEEQLDGPWSTLQVVLLGSPSRRHTRCQAQPGSILGHHTHARHPYLLHIALLTRNLNHTPLCSHSQGNTTS